MLSFIVIFMLNSSVMFFLRRYNALFLVIFYLHLNDVGIVLYFGLWAESVKVYLFLRTHSHAFS